MANTNAPSTETDGTLSMEQLIELLKKGVDAFNEYRAEHPEAPINLYSADLSLWDLEGVNFADANLERANLERANLKGASLMRAKLSQARLCSANLEEARLDKAQLNSCNRTNLRRANLRRARLYETQLGEADLIGANLDEAVFNGADLTGANLEEASLLCTDGLMYALLVSVRWRGCRGVRREIIQASMLLTQATIEFAKE